MLVDACSGGVCVCGIGGVLPLTDSGRMRRTRTQESSESLQHPGKRVASLGCMVVSRWSPLTKNQPIRKISSGVRGKTGSKKKYCRKVNPGALVCAL